MDFTMIWLIKLIMYPTIVLYGALAIFAFKNVNKILKKYRDYPEVQVEPEWQGFIRKDFNQWDQRRIKIGCFLRFPWKFMTILFYVLVLGIIILLTSKFSTLCRKIVNVHVKIFGNLTLLSLMNISQQTNRQKITTPMIISNHVNWFDIMYFTTGIYPLSIVSKQSIAKVPLIGLIAKYIQCLFISRQSQEGRKSVLEKIKQRMVDYQEKQNIHPLLIFPEGTTSNGRSLIRFKIGAFSSLPKITIFGLVYECQGFDMGMDEVNPLEHFIISLALSPKLRVKSQKIQPRSYQDAAQYMKRCQQKLSELTEFKIYNAGYTQKCSYKESRQSRKKE